jgi:hypothetical protein
MKIFFLLIAFYFIQQAHAQKKTFMRVYQTGKLKTVRGFYAGFTDSAIIIFSHQQSDTIFYSGIQQIRTRRSGGHNILLGVVSGFVAGTITGLATYKKPAPQPPPDPNCGLCPILNYEFSFTQGEAAFAGGFLGSVGGLAAGGIISLARKKITFPVAGNFTNWLSLRKILETQPAYNFK